MKEKLPQSDKTLRRSGTVTGSRVLKRTQADLQSGRTHAADGAAEVRWADRGVDIKDAFSFLENDPAFMRGEASRNAIDEAARVVRVLREKMALSQKDLAEKVGTTQPEIARIESGGGGRGPTVGTLQKIARACGVHLVVGFVSEMGELDATQERIERSVKKLAARTVARPGVHVPTTYLSGRPNERSAQRVKTNSEGRGRARAVSSTQPKKTSSRSVRILTVVE